MKMSFLKPFVIAGLIVSPLSFTHSQTLLIEDTFTRTTDGNLSADLPTTDNVGGLAWGGRFDTAVTNSGELIMTPGTGTNTNRTYFLNLGSTYFSNNPAIYSLSFDVEISAGSPDSSGNWFGLGFVNGPDVSQNMSTPDQRGGEPWIRLNQAGGLDVFMGRGTQNSEFSGTGYSSGQTYSFELVLDTTQTNWTVAAFVNDTQLDLNSADAGSMLATYSSNPTGLTSIAISPFGDGTATFTGDNFRLTSTAIPEPNSYAIVVGLVAILGVLRRRR